MPTTHGCSLPPAGAILDSAVASTKPLRLALELGTYCGYSAVRVGGGCRARGMLHRLHSPVLEAGPAVAPRWGSGV